MNVDELIEKLRQFPSDTVVALAADDGVPHHVSRTSPQPWSQGSVVVLDISPRVVSEEDIS